MIVCESALLTILFVLLSVSSYTDCKSSRINNSILLISAISSIITDAIYYYLCASRYAFPFLINIGLISLISILLYAYHIWAAGDSKLLIAVALCIPGRFLTFWNIGTFPGFFIIVVTFLSAFLYVIIETIFLDIPVPPLF